MPKRLFILLICLAGIATPANSQDVDKKDSLLKVLATAKEDTMKVSAYLEIGNLYELDDFHAAGSYYWKAYQLSKKLNYKGGELKFISNYTYLLNVNGQFDSSLLLNKQAIQIAKSLNDNVALAKSWANTGNTFQYMDEYDSAVYCYEVSIKLFESSGDVVKMARIQDVLQNAYMKLGQSDKALKFGKAAVSILRTTDDLPSLGQALLNTANSFQSVGQTDSALTYYDEALAISRKINYKRLEALSLLDIGNIHFHQYNADSMKLYYQKSLGIFEQLGDFEGESNALRGIAHSYLLKKDFVAARNNIEKALVISDSLELLSEKYENLKSLSSVLYATHDIAGAERCLDSAQVIEDKFRGDEIQKKTLSIEKRFETEKKEARIKLQQIQLKRRTAVIYFLIAGAVALLVILLLSYRNYYHRKKLQQAKIDELEAEKQLTATEAVLKGEAQERTRLAKDLHDGLGGMLSGIKHSLGNMKENLIMTPDNAQAFERSIDMLDSSIKEMRRVAHNMMPEMLLKYGLDTALKEFCNDVTRSGAVHAHYQSLGLTNSLFDQTTAVTVYRIVQELVNNAIKHAAAKNILVQVHQSAAEKLLTITVEDDGKGFDTAVLQQAAGMGWKNIQSRVDFLKGKLDIRSSPGNGTSALIEIAV
ncbi:hypothetical protein DCC81_05195 [Chitinophaga parva]|uniref:histidine kinase n=1 Tax=Chitinophaga parva TaxID=2169414 RepID=A0A2T7BMG9_9BACT|nr:tetratricopeptide repeat protein [Chitinophaga parva]PUZ28877.1 hypothetical protein DCC81_05195 [Chitinophaga parva]